MPDLRGGLVTFYSLLLSRDYLPGSLHAGLPVSIALSRPPCGGNETPIKGLFNNPHALSAALDAVVLRARVRIPHRINTAAMAMCASGRGSRT